MTLEEFDAFFPKELKGLASVSDLEILLCRFGYDEDLVKDAVDMCCTRPMLIVSEARQVLLKLGYNPDFVETFLGKYTPGTITISDIRKESARYVEDYMGGFDPS
jgi:hypothetical protein